MERTVTPTVLARALAAFLAVDAVLCAIPVPAIERDLIRVGCTPAMRRAIPVVKGTAAVGLGAGFARPSLGRITARAVVLYFVFAVLAHVRIRDPLWRHLAPLGLLGASVVVATSSYPDPPPDHSTGVDALVGASYVPGGTLRDGTTGEGRLMFRPPRPAAWRSRPPSRARAG